MAAWLRLQISYLNRTLTLGTLFLVTTLKVLASNNAREAKKNVQKKMLILAGETILIWALAGNAVWSTTCTFSVSAKRQLIAWLQLSCNFLKVHNLQLLSLTLDLITMCLVHVTDCQAGELFQRTVCTINTSHGCSFAVIHLKINHSMIYAIWDNLYQLYSWCVNSSDSWNVLQLAEEGWPELCLPSLVLQMISSHFHSYRAPVDL